MRRPEGMSVEAALEYQMGHCGFCDGSRKERRFFFVSNAQPVVICDMCVGALNVQMFMIELHHRQLEDPTVKQ